MTNCMSIDWKFFRVTGLRKMIGSFDLTFYHLLIRLHVPESEPIKNIIRIIKCSQDLKYPAKRDPLAV